MSEKWQFGSVAVAILAFVGVGCGSASGKSDGGTGNVGGATGGSSGVTSSGGVTSNGGTSTVGSGGVPSMGSATSNGLACTTVNEFNARSIACNGSCLIDPGDESAGCRVLLRSYEMNSLVADKKSIFVSDAAEVPNAAGTNYDIEPSRIAIYDRASKSVVGEVIPAKGVPYVRAVSDSHIVFVNMYDDADSSVNALRVVSRGTGAITDSTMLVNDIAIEDSTDPTEQAWIQGGTVYFQEDAGAAKSLHSVPVTGGNTTDYNGYVVDLVDVPSLTAFGFATMTSGGQQLYQMVASAEPVPIGDLVSTSVYASGRAYADANNVYFLQSINAQLDLLVVTREGKGVRTIATFAESPIVGAGSEGFIIFSGGLLQLIPLTGTTPRVLADFGKGTTVTHAQIVDQQVYVVARSHYVYSSYLLEIDLN